MTIKQFFIFCGVCVALGLIAHVFTPAGYVLVTTCAVVAPIFLVGFFIGIYNMVVEHNKMKREREKFEGK